MPFYNYICTRKQSFTMHIHPLLNSGKLGNRLGICGKPFPRTLFITLLLSCVVSTHAQRIAVISDIHLLAPELQQASLSAERLITSEAKMVHKSDAIMAYTTDTLLRLHPDLVLISGDLTYNGERASHQRLCQHLSRLHQAGIAVCVVPGNHDICNPYARKYLTTRAEDTDTVSTDDFASLYADFGYAGTTAAAHFMRDTLSLSYSITPLPGLTVLGIDSNRYTENLLMRRGDERNENLTAGRIRPETLAWLCDRATEARAAGCKVIALMHHHLVEHFDGESTLLPRYIIPEAETAVASLATAGVRVIFTGHLHITDAVTSLPASSGNPSCTITDVSTGSLTTYPFPLRLGTINPEGELTLETCFLHPSDSLVKAGRQQLEHGINTIANMMADRIWERFGKRMTEALSLLALFGGEDTALPTSSRQLAELIVSRMRPTLLRCMLTVTQGNEPETDPTLLTDLRQDITRLLASFLPASAEDTAQEIVTNLWPRIEPVALSIFRDINHVGLDTESRTDDHSPVISL